MSDYLRCETPRPGDAPPSAAPVPADASDLAGWLGLDVVYTCWDRTSSGGEKNPASLFADARLKVGFQLKISLRRRPPSPRC